ncbi:GntR family transcriptional regulator, partial [Micromonospora harpali]
MVSNSNTPLWEGLYKELRERIVSRDLPPNSEVPREMQLAAQYGI